MKLLLVPVKGGLISENEVSGSATFIAQHVALLRSKELDIGILWDCMFLAQVP